MIFQPRLTTKNGATILPKASSRMNFLAVSNVSDSPPHDSRAMWGCGRFMGATSEISWDLMDVNGILMRFNGMFMRFNRILMI